MNAHEESEAVEGISEMKFMPVLAHLAPHANSDMPRLAQAFEASRADVTQNAPRLMAEGRMSPEGGSTGQGVSRAPQFLVKWMDIHNPSLLRNPATQQLLAQLANVHGAHFSNV